MRNFRKLKVWEGGMEIVKITYSLSKQLPAEERLVYPPKSLVQPYPFLQTLQKEAAVKSDKDKKSFWKSPWVLPSSWKRNC